MAVVSIQSYFTVLSVEVSSVLSAFPLENMLQLPLWLAQNKLSFTVTDEFMPYATEVLEQLTSVNIRATLPVSDKLKQKL